MPDDPAVAPPIPTPAAPASPLPALTPAPAPPMISIPLDQLQAFTSLQARMAQMEAENRQRETAATEERVRILTEKNDAVNAVKTVREQKDAELKLANDARLRTEESAKRYALDGALARALAGAPIVPFAAEHLTKLWRGEFRVHEENGSFNVRTDTFQTVEQFVAEKLATPEYANFVAAKNPAGGTAGTTGGDRAAPTGEPPAAVPAAKNVGEMVLLDMQKARKLAGENSNLNLRMPAGVALPG